MKRCGLSILFGLLSFACYSQLLELKEFTGMLDFAQSKLENHLQKKGFRKGLVPGSQDFEIAYIKQDRSESKSNTRYFQILHPGSDYELIYQTSSFEEYAHLTEEIKSSGYICPKKSNDTTSLLYQRESIRIESSRKTNDSTLFYVLRAMKKNLPRKKDILTAEDLLQLDGEEYLKEVFGKENVKTDLFSYSATEANKCSVLFPNTNREAIFIWNDEANMKDISFILIGGELKTKDKSNNLQAISTNAWVSKQGIYCGMSLREVHLLNKEPVRFYNWHTESAGHLAPGNRGNLAFDQLKIVFGCLNCSFLKVNDVPIVESADALGANQKVYVTTLILLPARKTNMAR